MAEVRGPVDGGAAHVHRHLAGLAGLERDDLALGGVEQLQHGGRLARTRRPGALARRLERPGTVAGHERRARSRHLGASWSVPEKPTLDGLEATWDAALGGRGHLPLRPHRRPGTRSSRSTPRRRPSAGSLHVGHVFSYTHTDTIARYQRMRGQGGLLPDGLGRQRPAHRAPGRRTTTASAATRRSPTTPTSSRRRRPTPRTSRADLAGRNFVELCERLTAEDEKAFEDLWRRARPVGRLGADLHHHRRRARSAPPAGVPAQPGPRRGLPGRGARRCGTSTSAPPSPRPSSRTASCPAPTTASPFHRPDGGEPVFIETTRPELLAGLRRPGRPPRRRALPAAVRHHGHARRCSASRSRSSPTSWPSPRRAPASP